MGAREGVFRAERNAFVYIADLDLTRFADAQTLYERIRYAARTICTADELSFDAERALHAFVKTTRQVGCINRGAGIEYNDVPCRSRRVGKHRANHFQALLSWRNRLIAGIAIALPNRSMKKNSN